MIGVLDNDITVPSTKAAATVGMNQPGLARARHSDQMATTASRMPNTMLPTWPRSLSGHASAQTGGQNTIGKPLVSAAQPAPRIPALATPLPLPDARHEGNRPPDLDECNADKRCRLAQSQHPVQVEQADAEVDDDVHQADNIVASPTHSHTGIHQSRPDHSSCSLPIDPLSTMQGEPPSALRLRSTHVTVRWIDPRDS